MIAVLPVEVENVFDGPEVAGFVVVSGGIFDVVKVEFVFTGGCNGCGGVGTGTLESLITVNRTSIVACMGCLVAWTPEATPPSGESVATEL